MVDYMLLCSSNSTFDLILRLIYWKIVSLLFLAKEMKYMNNSKQDCKNFINLVVDELERYFGNDYIITISQRMLTNGMFVKDVMIKKDGQNIIPVIYLNSFYERYYKGVNLDELMQEIIREYEYSIATAELFYLNDILEFSKVKERVIMKLVSNNSNNQSLIDTLNVKYFDMLILFYIVIKDDKNINALITIKEHYLKYWKTTKNELIHYASISSKLLLPTKIEPFYKVISQIGMEKAGAVDVPSENKMEATKSFTSRLMEESKLRIYILTNISNLNGAACILYDGVLREFAEKINYDLIIIPSSIHEVFLLPAFIHINTNKLKVIVEEVNSQMLEEEILSDKIYYYNRATNLINEIV